MNPEPTLSDVLEAVQTGFARLEFRMGNLEAGQEELSDRVGALERRVGSVEIKIEDMAETLDAVAQAGSKDAETIVDHERRIVHLEKAAA